jgi:predicted  nucleic acid-binding Zn-ribbon protein
MNSDKRKSGNMDNIGERYKDKLTEHRDWMDGMSAFREETKDRMIDLNSRINELELSLEESIQNIREYLESAKKKS